MFQADEIEELNTAIKDKDDNMEVILRSYFPNTTAECVYKVFTLWAGLGYDSWIFFRSKAKSSNPPEVSAIQDIRGQFVAST